MNDAPLVANTHYTSPDNRCWNAQASEDYYECFDAQVMAGINIQHTEGMRLAYSPGLGASS